MKSGTQKLKKLLAFVMTAVMVLTAVPLGGLTFSASAENGEFIEGYYTYTVENGEATITDCDTSISGEVVIPAKLGGYPVTSIGDSAFARCASLTSVEIPNSVTSIGDYAFYFCTLTSIAIPDSVINIGDYAFSCCEILTSVIIPNSVIKIGMCAFQYCSDLLNVTISNSVTSIGDFAFGYCTQLRSVTIPYSVISIGDRAFSYCTRLNNINVSDENPSYSSLDGVLFNKDKTELIQYPIGNIRKEYVIPNSVTKVCKYAFLWCDYCLTSIEIPDSVTKIDYDAFNGCTSLTGVTIPSSVTSIGDYAFGFNLKYEQIKNFTIYGYTGTTAEVYANRNDFEFISLGDGEHTHAFDEQISSQPTCTKNGEKIFACMQCGYNYTDVIPATGHIDYDNNKTCDVCGESTIIDNGKCGDNLSWTLENNGVLTIFGTGDMWDNPIELDRDLIKNIVINNGVTSIGGWAFQYCKSLIYVEIPNSVTNIGNSAFNGCSSLTKITIPNSVTSIGDWAFGYCISLTNFIIPNSVTNIGIAAFAYCDGLASITIPSSVTNIGNAAFVDCDSLTSAIIPRSLTNIGINAFGYIANNRTAIQLTDFTIYGYTGTAAETYANENGFKFVALAEHIHVYAEDITRQPTCTENGVKTFTCSCGESYTEVIPALGHTETTVKGTPATCTENGLTDGTKCSVCGEVIKAQEVIPATGHTDSNNDGKCDTCGEKLRETEPSNPSANCKCLCHKTGFMGFIYKIARFLWKLFKTHKTCDCGVAHY